MGSEMCIRDRPISLLNVDYKILTKSIAKRLEKVLPKIINSDQTGYIKGRFIGENVRLPVIIFLKKVGLEIIFKCTKTV